MTDPFAWPAGKRGALCLTYDDCLPVHRELVAPLLHQHGITGTFYIPTARTDLFAHVDGWRAVAAMGHELGNHSIWHPCWREPSAPPNWVIPEYNLANYTERRFRDELLVADRILGLIDGQPLRTYGNTCHHRHVGADRDTCIDSAIRAVCLAGRGEARQALADPLLVDLGNIGNQAGDGKTLDQLQAVAERARTENAWAILTIHGVGADTHGLHLHELVHQGFVAWLAEQTDLWCASVRNVAHHVAKQRGLPLTVHQD